MSFRCAAGAAGTLRIISSFGFGRRVVAPALSALARQYPQLEMRFDVGPAGGFSQ
jgi:DNA-binding transcriptional LysR family regulator